jgi:hypothetical protein
MKWKYIPTEIEARKHRSEVGRNEKNEISVKNN